MAPTLADLPPGALFRFPDEADTWRRAVDPEPHGVRATRLDARGIPADSRVWSTAGARERPVEHVDADA